MTDDIRVMLVDDQQLVRRGFRMVLEAEDGIVVVGEAGDGQAAVEAARAHRPDVVLMDVRMPGMDGIRATELITAMQPGCRVIVLTTFDLDEYAFGGLQAGASGFLLKDARPSELVDAIRAVHRGDAVVAPRVTARLVELAAPALARTRPTEQDRLDVLSEREREVFRLMAEGATNAEIAERLFVSESTVKTHVGKVLRGLGLRDRVQAVILAYEIGAVGS
ncbi:response regulator [Microbacterium sp. 179-I 3D4 NHS]|uniref:response regulator n=1 Tax=Microbacterium sp. 179-I 3D4 NHS TaxID=3142381 RepID=UPI0039A2A97C